MIVYLLLNTVNNKCYVGQHRGSKISTRWTRGVVGANPHLRRAVKKYGWELFSKEILCYCFSQDEMNNMERIWIITLRTYDSGYGYNKTMGGEGGTLTEEVKKKIGDSKRGKPNPGVAVYRRGRPSPWAAEILRKKWANGKVAHNKGKKFPNCSLIKINHSRSGRTYEEIYGEEKAKKISLKQGTTRSKMVWITDGTTSTRILGSNSIPQGFWGGRRDNNGKMCSKKTLSGDIAA